MSNLPEHFCILPWINQEARTNGEIGVCCVMQETVPDMNLADGNTLADAWNRKWLSDLKQDFLDGKIPKEPKFILLQYGGTLQVCAYKKMHETEDLPKLKSGEEVSDLGEYMTGLLTNFQKHLGYYDPDTSIGQDEITVSGGHGGIGSISNIIGTCKKPPYEGLRFIDMFKNKIINDLSGVAFNMKLVWSEPSEWKSNEPEMDYKVVPTEKVTKLDSEGRLKKFDDMD